MICYRRLSAADDLANHLFTTQFNRHRIQQHVIERAGAGFHLSSSDFLVSSDADFHPTDLLQDADGSLLIVDTGGWFRIGCPQSQVAKPAILGAIYRLRRVGEATPPDPRGSALDWKSPAPETLIAFTNDARPQVRERAISELARRGDAAVPALQEQVSRIYGQHKGVAQAALWALSRIETPAARTAVRNSLALADDDVRRLSARISGLYRDTAARQSLERLLVHPDFSIRREAACALGRIGKGEAVPALLAAADDCKGDRFLEHAVIYALIQINDPTVTAAGLAANSPAQQRAALIALDQMDAGKLLPKDVLPLAESSDPALRQTAIGVLASHADWSEQTANLLERWLSPTQYELRRDAILAVVPPLLKGESVQKLMLERLDDSTMPVKQRELVLETMALAPGAAKPSWIAPIGKALADADPKLVRQAVATAASLRDPKLDEPLLKAARSNDNAADARAAAYAAAGMRLKDPANGDLAFLISRLNANLPPLERLTAARAIGTIPWSDAQLEGLIPRVSQVGPVESPHLLAAFEKSTSDTVGRRLVLTLMNTPSANGISADALKRTLAKYPPSVQRSAEPLLKRLSPNSADQQAKVDELDKQLTGGDTGRGKAIFFSAKAACATCHSIGGQGGQVGPDLSKIGAIRTRRDLVESIVFPSASFAREFETLQVSTNDGEVYAGTLARESSDAIYLRTPAEIRIPRANVKKTQISPVSVMPQGLDAAVTKQELADVLAFLQSLVK
jgi:putative heme-binding domain-containing protein